MVAVVFVGPESLSVPSNCYCGSICSWDGLCYFYVAVQSIQAAQDHFWTGNMILVWDLIPFTILCCQYVDVGSDFDVGSLLLSYHWQWFMCWATFSRT